MLAERYYSLVGCAVMLASLLILVTFLYHAHQAWRRQHTGGGIDDTD